MTNKEREILAATLAEIDRRHAELEYVLQSLPPRSPLREDLQTQLAELWRYRAQLAKQIGAAIVL
jgi:hypothetical protein